MSSRIRLFSALVLLAVSIACTSIPETTTVIKSNFLPALPYGITNNAVTAVPTRDGLYLLSFNGLLKGKNWNDTSAQAFALAPGASTWQRLPDVPGSHGRLASIAATVGMSAYVFGGYTVAEDHSEVSLPLVHRFDPITKDYTRLADMPVPVDDAMALVYEDRYIYVISGWHDTANVNLVQRYDTIDNTWTQATAFPGAPVFGHAGGIVDNTLVVCGGVKIKTHVGSPREFVMSTQCYAGSIRANDTRRIDWRVIDPMPGAARYRMATSGSTELGGVVFIGGSNNPYNYNGIGYNGKPSVPSHDAWLYHLENNLWIKLGVQSTASMDHRGLMQTNSGYVTVGGMLTDQKVTGAVVSYSLSIPSR